MNKFPTSLSTSGTTSQAAENLPDQSSGQFGGLGVRQLNRSVSLRVGRTDEATSPTSEKQRRKSFSLRRMLSRSSSTGFLGDPDLLHKSLESLSPAKPRSVSNLSADLAATRQSFNPDSDPSRDDLNKDNLLRALEKMAEDKPLSESLFSAKDFSLLLTLNQVVRSGMGSNDLKVLLEYMANVLVIQVVDFPAEYDEHIEALLSSDKPEDQQLGLGIRFRKLSWAQMGQLRLHRNKSLQKLAQLIDRRAEFFCVDDVSEERLQEIAEDPRKVNKIGLDELNDMRRKAIADRAPKPAAKLERAGFLEDAARLRKELESFDPDNPQSVAALVDGIKLTLTSQVIQEKCKEGSVHEKTIHMIVELSQAVEGGSYFHKADLPLLVKLRKAVECCEDRVLFYTLMGQLAHCVVVELLDRESPMFQVAIGELTRGGGAGQDLAQALVEKRTNFVELEAMRDIKGAPQKLADAIALRRNYVSEDSCTEERLAKIAAQPKLLNEIKGYKRELLKLMDAFEREVDLSRVTSSPELAGIRGSFLVLKENVSRREDELEVNKVMTDAMDIVRDRKGRAQYVPECLMAYLREQP